MIGSNCFGQGNKMHELRVIPSILSRSSRQMQHDLRASCPMPLNENKIVWCDHRRSSHNVSYRQAALSGKSLAEGIARGLTDPMFLPEAQHEITCFTLSQQLFDSRLSELAIHLSSEGKSYKELPAFMRVDDWTTSEYV